MDVGKRTASGLERVSPTPWALSGLEELRGEANGTFSSSLQTDGHLRRDSCPMKTGTGLAY